MTKKKSPDRHLEPKTSIRFPKELKKDLKEVSKKHKLTMNNIVVRGTQKIVTYLKNKDSLT